jgi:hypothetical protein
MTHIHKHVSERQHDKQRAVATLHGSAEPHTVATSQSPADAKEMLKAINKVTTIILEKT